MKYLLAAVAACAALLVTPVLAADANAPSFENGPVWDYAHIRTKDGHFDDYMKWLSTEWKPQEEALKRRGLIVGYKVLLVQNPRENEPDVVLAQEYANMAAFDMPVSKTYAVFAEISGSLAKSNQEQAARGSIRTILSDVLVREAIMK